MAYLFDTNVLSEFVAKQPNPNVLAWVSAHQHQTLYLSVISVGEIQQGIARLPVSNKQTQLTAWLQTRLLVEYDDFILPIERDIMLHWGNMMAKLTQQGQPMPYMDSLIAATAQWHHLALVTRNTNDFTNLDLPLINPWLA